MSYIIVYGRLWEGQRKQSGFDCDNDKTAAPREVHAEDHAQQIDYLRYAYATIDAIAPDAQTSSRAV